MQPLTCESTSSSRYLLRGNAPKPCRLLVGYLGGAPERSHTVMLGIATKGCPVLNTGPGGAGFLLGGRPQCSCHCPHGLSCYWRRRKRTNIAQILENIGIGWLVLVLVAMFATLALALSNGGPAVLYSDVRLFALLLARCSVADSWPSDGAVEDVRPIRTDPDERAHRTNRLVWVPSGTCQKAPCSLLQSLSLGHGRHPMRDFQRILELAQQHRCLWARRAYAFGRGRHGISPRPQALGIGQFNSDAAGLFRPPRVQQACQEHCAQKGTEAAPAGLRFMLYKARSGGPPQRHRSPADADVFQCRNWV